MTPTRPTLTELARLFNSDKLLRHSYLPTYERLLGNRKVHRLCEIGIGNRDLMQPFLPAGVEYCHGSSLKMWTTYWPEAEIWACDIREDTLINEGNIRSVVCDQGSGASLAEMVCVVTDTLKHTLDVVIDDGSHIAAHQELTASVLLPRLSKGGVMIVEDCWPDKGAELALKYGGVLVAGYRCPDDNLVVFER